MVMKRPSAAPSTKVKTPEDTATNVSDEKKPEDAGKPPTTPAAIVPDPKEAPAVPPAVEKEDLQSQLSKTDSLEAKLDLVRGAEMAVTEKVEILNKSLDLKEWNKLNGRYNTAKKRNPEVALLAEQHAGNKKHRTMVACLALDPTMQDVWQEMKHTVTGSQALTKTDEWISWTQMLKDWTEEEIQLHLQSGRFSQRECPDTAGVWELKDNNKVKTEKVVARAKTMDRSTKEQLKPENQETDLEEWGNAWNAYGSANSFNDLHLFGAIPPKGGKGGTKGIEATSAGQPSGKGKGKGKGTSGKGKKDLDPTALVDKKKATFLKTLVAKEVMWLGCLGFEAEAEKDKKDILEAKQQMEAYKEKVQEAEKFTVQQYLDMLKEVTTLQDSNSNKFKK